MLANIFAISPYKRPANWVVSTLTLLRIPLMFSSSSRLAIVALGLVFLTEMIFTPIIAS